MASHEKSVEIRFPPLPVKHEHFIQYATANKDKPMKEILEPFKQYDAELRKVFAQRPEHPAAKQPNIVPIFVGHEENVSIRARDIRTECNHEKEAYILPLKDEQRRSDGSPAIVQSLKEFQTNFNVFSESALADLDFSNVVVAGSAVVTPLLALPEKFENSKRALRELYHEKLAPASDVDLFLYGLSEEQAKNKIEQIEQCVRDSILKETTTVRTKNAITIASQYPVRHIQIVLRIYKSVSEILTGFDVDCSCAAYDGQQVYASPRALAAYMTQINTIDLTRRSPSYESRLSKYGHRGFEVYWPELDRSKIDPTIYERNFSRTEGLARLLILEKLPKSADRDSYLDMRRAERGRPTVNRWHMKRRMIAGNIKNDHEDEVADWVSSDEISDYHTFTIPYGPRFHARMIEKLLFTKDLLLNAEWNMPKDREVNLHRHPAFFGKAADVFIDCCECCPKPYTAEEEEVALEESKIYVSGEISFIKDNPGRQTIGSFNPLDAAGWTEMAYVGNTACLCQAIIDGDIEYVNSWLGQEGHDPNTRDYTGRTPLHLAVSDSTVEIVQCLIDHGARLVARLVDGRTALHLAAMRGNAEIVSALLRKSEENEDIEKSKLAIQREERIATKKDLALTHASQEDIAVNDLKSGPEETESDVEMIHEDEAKEDEEFDATTENSMVKIKPPTPDSDDRALLDDQIADQPDVYDVNVLAWDSVASPLHLAIISGHEAVVKCLVEDHGAGVLLPIKLVYNHRRNRSARAAILTLVLALQLPIEKAERMTRLLIQLGASCAQADIDQNTALHYAVGCNPAVLETLLDADRIGVNRAINHLAVYGWMPLGVRSALMTAIDAQDSLTALRLLEHGAKPAIEFEAYMEAYRTKIKHANDFMENHMTHFRNSVEQPIVHAVRMELPDVAAILLEQHGVDPNTLTKYGYMASIDARWNHTQGKSLLDEVRDKLETLKRWSPDSVQYTPPLKLNDDASYLASYPEASYRHWTAQKQLATAKEAFERDLESYEADVEKSKHRPGIPEKQAAITKLVQDFEGLEAILLQKGGKTFKELHPEIKDPDPRYRAQFSNGPLTQAGRQAFQVSFRFQPSAVPDELHERYIDLFEAVWHDDLQTVKRMTLLPWKDSTGQAQAPLRISVTDYSGLNPFAIAILQGSLELATAILEIAQAQYEPPAAPQRHVYRLDGGNDDDSDCGDDDIKVYSEIIDEQFTIETIGQVSLQVKSAVKPIEVLLQSYPVTHFLFGPSRSSTGKSGSNYFGLRGHGATHGSRESTGSLKARAQNLSEEKRREIGDPRGLIQLALYMDDLDLLVYLLDLAEQYTRTPKTSEQNDTKLFFTIHEKDFLMAIMLDKPHLISKIIKRTGAGLPFDQLIRDSGVQSKDKPKGYQGLSVYGRKRKDWADTARHGLHYAKNAQMREYSPPLLYAARYGSLETVQWFLGDAPMRCYGEFAKTYEEDKRIKTLSLAKGGFNAVVSGFLNARSHLAMHCCLIGFPTPESTNVLRFLTEAMAESINAKSLAGIAPLHIAFRTHQLDAIRILIDAGADQACRDKQGQNIVHHVLQHAFTSDDWLGRLPSLFDLIDRRLLPSLFQERSSADPGSMTPFAQWTRQGQENNRWTKLDAHVLQIMLQYSNGSVLSFINGEGNSPLHVAIRDGRQDIAKVIIDHDPALLLRENATGRTPFEIARDQAIATVCSDPPSLNYVRHGFAESNLAQRSAEDFLKTKECAEKEKLWDTVQRTMAELKDQGKGKRRLVTLNEANEVARRLEARDKRSQRVQRVHRSRRARLAAARYERFEDIGSTEMEPKDEVDMWL